uniref:Transposase-associated domain-containing protein n=1 Tax=Quercus lobata TaxID=97700 RepID=A0A7N2R3Z2_QUELO
MGDKIYCPCKKCNNYFAKTRDDVEADLLTIGILPSYTHWFRHGEERHFQTCDSLDSNDESDGDGLSEMVEDYCAAFNAASCVAGDSSGDSTPEEPMIL